MVEYLWIVWLSVFVIGLIIETGTTELVSIFFSFGALIAMIISFIPGVEWWVQLIIFVVLSGASLAALRPIVKKYLNKEKLYSYAKKLGVYKEVFNVFEVIAWN